MSLLLANNATSFLAAGISNSDTSLTVRTGDGAKFPAPSPGDWFPLTIVRSDSSLEIVRCTARTADTFTIVRAQEGTAALEFNAGDRVELRATAGSFEWFRQEVDGEIQSIQDILDGLGTAATRDVGTGPNEVPTNSDLGSAALLEAIGTAPLYGQDSILGTVSQESGVPAGAIIESGSNANGEYVKWADGTQICLLRTTVTNQALDTAYAGGLYQGTRSWIFPAGFITTPSVTCSEFRWGSSANWGTIAGASATGASLRGIDTVSRSTGTATTISAIAIGRWY